MDTSTGLAHETAALDLEAIPSLREVVRQVLDSEAEAPELLRQMQPRWLGQGNAGADALLDCLARLEGVEASGQEPVDGGSRNHAASVFGDLSAEIQRRRRLAKEQSRNARQRESLAGRHESMWLRMRTDELLRKTWEETGVVARSHEEQIRDSSLPHGKFHELARAISERIETEDLQIEDLSDSSIVQLREDCSLAIQQRIARELLVHLDEHAGRANRESTVLVDRTSQRMGTLMGWRIAFQQPVYDATRIQDFAATAVLAPIPFQNEFPRVSRGAFVWQAFIQPAMLSGMLLMPFWILTMNAQASKYLDAGIKRSSFLLVLFAILYPGYIFYQRQKVPKDRRNRIRRELQKARQVVRTEVERICRAVLDEQKRDLGDHWRRLGDELRQQVMECIGLAAEARQSPAEAERRILLLDEATKLLEAHRAGAGTARSKRATPADRTTRCASPSHPKGPEA